MAPPAGHWLLRAINSGVENTRESLRKPESLSHKLNLGLGLPPRQRRLFGQPDEPTLVKPDEHARLQGQKLS